MIQQLIEFFENNPEATEVHEALGFLHTDKNKAEARLLGVAGVEVKTFTKEEVESEETPKDAFNAEDHQIIKSFRKMKVEKMAKVIEQQTTLVEKKEASLKAEDDQEKALKSLEFHKDILRLMQEAQKLKSENPDNV